MNTTRALITPFETFVHYYNKAEKHYGRYYNIFYTITNTYESLQKNVQFSPWIKSAVRWMGYYSVIDLVFAGPRLVSNITDVVKESSLYARAGAFFEAVSEVIGIALQISFIIDTAKELGYLAKNALARMPDTSKLYLPYYSIFLYQSVDHWVSLQSCYRSYRDTKDMKSRLTFVAKDGHTIQKTLYLSKKLKLSSHAAHLITELEKGACNAKNDAEKFLQALNRRFMIRHVLDSSYCVINLAAVAVMLTPTHPVVSVAYAISNIASVIFTIIDNKKILN